MNRNTRTLYSVALALVVALGWFAFFEQELILKYFEPPSIPYFQILTVAGCGWVAFQLLMLYRLRVR